MNCAYCKHTDGVVYLSLPPKYKCSITGEYHLALDDCDVDFEPIVRCKDCTHYDGRYCITAGKTVPRHEDWFCADGKRKE